MPRPALRAALLACAGMAAPLCAHAQTSQSETITIGATLEKSQSPLFVRVSNGSFGTVQIPYELPGFSGCVYATGAGGTETAALDGNDLLTVNNPIGCGISGGAVPSFEMNCPVSRTASVSVAVLANTIPGVYLDTQPSFIATDANGQGQARSPFDTSYDAQAISCDEIVEVDRMQLTVLPSAEPGDYSVGTIRVDADFQ